MTALPDITIARVYDARMADGRARLLVDRLWPRGLTKAELALDAWLRDVTPSTGLRRWFHQDPAHWDAFRERYQAELSANPTAVSVAEDWCRRGPVTLLTAARDRTHNHAVVLRDHLIEACAKGDGGR